MNPQVVNVRRMLTCVGVIFLHLAIGLSVAYAGASDLDVLVKEALAHSPEWTALSRRADAMRAVIPQAGALADPTVGLLLDDVPNDLDVTRAAQIWLTAEQAIPFPGKRALRVEQAEIEAQMANLAARMKAAEIRADITRAWARLIGLRQERAINTQSAERLQTVIDLAQLKFATGRGMQADILIGQMERTALLQKQASLEEEEIQVIAEINRLRGQPVSAVLMLTGELPLPPELPTREALLERASQTRPQAREAALQKTRGSLARRMAEIARRPDFGVKLGRGQMRHGPDVWMAMFSVSIPNFWADTQTARMDEAAALSSAAEQDEAADRLRVESELAQALSRIKIHRQILEVAEKTLRPLAEAAVEALQLAYQSDWADWADWADRADRADFGSVLKGEEARGEVEREIVRARVALWEAIAQIEHLIGSPL